ncbi:MAG: ribonuclease Z [Lentimicrobiaceae bacterium]|jgi:ribonuclease Z
MLPFNLTILGSSSATPTSDRNPTSQLLSHGEKLFLIDCGEGTQVSLRRMHIHFQRIKHIFISHLHGDHFYGLIGLVSSMHLLGRTKALHIYGPPMLKEIIDLQLLASQTTLIYPLEFHLTQAEKPEVLFEDELIAVTSFPMLHRIPTTGFLFQEKPYERKMRKDVIDLMKIPVHLIPKLRRGEDYVATDGTVHPNKDITIDPPLPRTYAFCSDTAYSEDIIPVVRGASLLYHETTFMNDRIANAAEKFHSTTGQAAAIALKSDVKKLVIGHYSARYDDLQPLLNEARAVFPGTELAEDGSIFEIQ